MLQDSFIGRRPRAISSYFNWGMFWLIVATVTAGIFFRDGIQALLVAWQTPEYSHGPLIPVLSAFLFLRHLKVIPANDGPVADRWPGFIVLAVAMVLGLFGRVIEINDIIAYALILWVGAILLISFGWRVGILFWPSVLHLVYMLPLPEALYYGVSTQLQFISSELGVMILHLLQVPVFLDGNIIDLGVYKLHVAEACSGLRYLFPILSFSYIFAVLYRGPTWHKAVLLISAVPITVLMNSVRIGIAGYIVNYVGLDWLEGFSHFFEGWVIFVACVFILFILARILLMFQPQKMELIEALDLDTSGMWAQAARLRLIRPSHALISGAVLMVVLTAGFATLEPERQEIVFERDPLATFPRQVADWRAGTPQSLEDSVARILAADDYYSSSFVRGAEEAPVGLFIAWYKDQSSGGTHSPEVCLPGGGWEIADLQSTPAPGLAASETPFELNRVIIQNGEKRMLVYYWYEHYGQRTSSEFTAKLRIMKSKMLNGREESSIIRLTTVIGPNETEADAEARLNDFLRPLLERLPRFIPQT